MSTKGTGFLSEDNIYRDLTIAILVVFALSPILDWLTGSHRFHSHITVAFLLFALYQITRRRSDMLIGLGLGLPAIVGGIVNAQTADTPAINLGPTVLGGLFIGFIIWRVLRDVTSGTRITSERIFGAVCAYLLIGFLFANFYAFILLADPDAFSVTENLSTRLAEREPGMGGILTYFSFVTQTTLGYGDITPVSPAARTLAWIQALVGQLYLAITIAGLVGIHIAGRTDRS
jgi:hypothetical protein